MDKKPKSIETQIQLLKSRGMILKDESTYENMGYKNCLSLKRQGMPCPHRLRQIWISRRAKGMPYANWM